MAVWKSQEHVKWDQIHSMYAMESTTEEEHVTPPAEKVHNVTGAETDCQDQIDLFSHSSGFNIQTTRGNNLPTHIRPLDFSMHRKPVD